MQSPVKVRTAETRGDVLQVVGLTASAFAEEVRGAGLTAAEWVDIETTEYERNPGSWSHIGLACQEDMVLGAVVLKMGGEVEEHMSYWEVNERVGVCPTFWTYLYDHILVDHLKPGECLIDFIAVSQHAQGKGVGKMLMKWAEDTATKLIAEREPSASHADLYLWVAAENSIAQRLYEKCGYAVISKTSEDPLACIMYNIYKSFLGHPIWLRMRKQVSLEALRQGEAAAAANINGAPVVEKIMRRISRSLSGGAQAFAASMPSKADGSIHIEASARVAPIQEGSNGGAQTPAPAAPTWRGIRKSGSIKGPLPDGFAPVSSYSNLQPSTDVMLPLPSEGVNAGGQAGGQAGERPALQPTLSLNRFMALTAAAAAEEAVQTPN